MYVLSKMCSATAKVKRMLMEVMPICSIIVNCFVKKVVARYRKFWFKNKRNMGISVDTLR